MSPLDKEYIEASRPYSMEELRNIQNKLYSQLRIGKIIASHKNCGHFYYTRKNGRKEKEIASNKSIDVGNCSVCWKLSHTEEHLMQKAADVVEKFSTNFFHMPHLTYENMFLEDMYYKWLYENNI